MSGDRKRRHLSGAGAVLGTLLAALALSAPLATPAQAAPSDPLFVYAPSPPPNPPPPDAPPFVPPTGYFNGPCGLTVDSSGRFWVSDHYHRAVGIFSFTTKIQLEGQPLLAHTPFGSHSGPADDPCALDLDSSGNLYLNNFHRNVVRFGAPISIGTGIVLPGSAHATGVAVDPSTDHVFVNLRDHVAEYDASGAFVRDIGAASLQNAYGIAVSGFSATQGFLYVPDAASNTVKVYDPATDTDEPVASISGPPGDFTSLSDSSIAVDNFNGDIYVADDLQPDHTEAPQSAIHVFSTAGSYRGHLKYNTVGSSPVGLAVDNSPSPRHPAGTQGRVYVTSGNTHRAAVYAYPPNAALGGTALTPKVPAPPLPGGGEVFPTVTIGDPAGGQGGCEGDACQVLPPEPTDPTLTTLLSGRGNPKERYRQYYRKGAKAQDKQKGKGKGHKKGKGKKHGKGKRPSAATSSAGSGPVAAAAAPSPVSVPAETRAASSSAPVSSLTSPASSGSASTSTPTTSGLLPTTEGFSATAIADGDTPATLAGSHPYELDFGFGLDPGEDLRDMRIDMPPGLLLNPANAFGTLCSDSQLATPRTNAFDPASESGEDCPAQAQVGTVEVTDPSDSEVRRFGLFSMPPQDGTLARFGVAPWGEPLVFDLELRSEESGTYLSLVADEIPQALDLGELGISLWGAPWDETHNAERGDCLNEAEPSFGWAKCSVGDALNTQPRAFVSLPARCDSTLSFQTSVASWQGSSESATAVNEDSGGDPVPLTGCAQLKFDFEPESLLSTDKASSASGYVFRFRNEDPGLTDPRGRTRAPVKQFSIKLPDGVTLNPSLGAGLGVCTPAQLAAESAFSPPGAGCPNASKIGIFRVSLPFYRDTLRGSIYLAKPDDPATSIPGAENPFDSLIAVYLVVKSADRGILIRVPGKLTPDPGDGTLTASFDGLPQLPYSDLEVNFRSGQRAPLVSPPHCGGAVTKATMSSWADGAPQDISEVASAIDRGSEDSPCPAPGTPPFSPEALSGGVNSNVGSYTPYYVKLSRKDTEQEITSYSLVLPKGITGKLAGVPFCAEAAIEAARHKRGFTETASPSCPAASQVGHTDTGYGVGKALTYAPGRIYLAGPYHGSPLSLVTINAATVGPFDLGTIVIRSAFDVDQRTAQLEIDSSASDPIPHIIDGVPVHLREVRIYMDRFQFTHNPSSCEASQLTSRLTGSGASFQNPADDSVTNVAKHFQLLNCLTLGFKPKLGLRLRGPSRRGGFPSLRATFASRGPKDSNLKKIEVEMPHSLFLAQNHIRTVCTKPQFQAERCPKGSIYGKAVAKTLLFDTPLTGNVYLRSSETKLPDLVADLHSGAIRIVVEGRIGPGKHGGILTFFDDLPDAPIDYFRMTLGGGRHGLLQNSVDICANPPLATVSALGQNNIGARFSSILRGQCGGKGKKKG
jgi:hypothetical protein